MQSPSSKTIKFVLVLAHRSRPIHQPNAQPSRAATADGRLSENLYMSFFDAVELAPRDPILGLNEQFNADPNPAKVNLGVGVYYDDHGKLPLLKCVARSGTAACPKRRSRAAICRSTASPPTTRRCRILVFGAESDAVKEGRVATVQTLGGTGALKVGADFLKRLDPARAGADQRPELGKPSRAVQPGRLHGRHVSVLRRRARPRRHRLRGHARRR